MTDNDHETLFIEALREPGSGELASTFPRGKEPPVDRGHRVLPDPGADGPDPEDDDWREETTP